MFKKFLTFVIICTSTISFGQGMFNLFGKNNGSFEREWQIGVGLDIVKFSKKDYEKIGDLTTIQIPRINVTKKISDSFSIDGAFSIPGFYSALSVENRISYFSFDASARYSFIKEIINFDPYALAGISIVDIDRKASGATLNVGLGASYWFSDQIGINTQVQYKSALDKTNMGSHTQFSASLLFALDSSKKISGASRCYYSR